MNKKTLILTTFSFLYSGVALATTPMCGPTPSCEDLGFLSTIASSCKHILYCPFDTNYKICVDKCRALPEKGDCAIGDIYYSDGTCSSTEDYNEKKLAVGVVFMLTDEDGNIAFGESSNHGRVINLHDLYAQDDYLFDPENPYSGTNSLYWGLYKAKTSLPYYANGAPTVEGSLANLLQVSDGQEGSFYIYTGGSNNTNVMASLTTSDCAYEIGTADYAKNCISPVARAALAFYPPNVDSSDPKVGAGKWYLPSIGELVQVYGFDASQVTYGGSVSGATKTTITSVNATLTFLRERLDPSLAAPLNGLLYSSAEQTSSYFWSVNIVNGTRRERPKNSEYDTRLILAF